MITTPISPAHILKGSPSPTSSTSGTGGKKTSRPPKGSKQLSSPISNQSSSTTSSIPPMTPNDQLPQQHVPSFKGPVIPPPTHFPYFPMNPMAMPNVPMMYAPINTMHMIPTTTPMFGMFPQPVMPNIPPPTTPHNTSFHKVPTPIQPKPSTSPPSSTQSTITTTQSSKTKPKKKKRPPTSNRNVNTADNSNNTSPVVISSNISKTAETTSNQKRKEPPTTSRSVHQHIISYLWELGLRDSAKILENDLNNPLLLNASEDRVSSFVNNLSNEVERHSHTIPPSNKKISTNEKSSSSNFTTTDETSIINSNENDSFMSESNNSTMDKYNSENYLNILKQTTKSESYNKPTAEYVNERLENLEQTLGVKEQKVQVFARMKEVEERMLKLDVNNNEIAQQQPLLGSSGTAANDNVHDDNFFDSFFEDDTDNHQMSESHFQLDNTDC
ncbi:predicted protein [Naegleria gruberi]|uniref:Predicted protein n=1 Tax=Naegleria gruberi TaxID=5762 RepID=D2VCI6_NAEGR|nr:uncharacterized protein NAEGRDRAFT_48433 [Naegleria gruberi]EFC45317.1 predicted protein [Naegleria gruberi]|eukprot:XP_002678061.1 predicted protein [Naegleria gruberi strain NEG-M]